ncbi:hypothetical protein [Actinoplanes sp. NPDC051411]|uniref:hypothetical protein n=1 Tax=Actinoplanes sp. NPDC051411 TaxID=3155522 RepID=UPI003417B6EB
MFAGAGSWLVSAGAKLIQGLINGIKSKLGPLGSALDGAAQFVRDHWPFSPAKIGPLSGKGDMRYAGQHLMDGLTRGVGDRRNDVARAVAAVAGDLAAPAFPALGFSGGRARGGDGASAAAPRGPITVNITISGQGKDAGQEAAEAFIEALANVQN